MNACILMPEDATFLGIVAFIYVMDQVLIYSESKKPRWTGAHRGYDYKTLSSERQHGGNREQIGLRLRIDLGSSSTLEAC